MTFNLVNGVTVTATLTGNIVPTLTTSAFDGETLDLELTQDATGSRTRALFLSRLTGGRAYGRGRTVAGWAARQAPVSRDRPGDRRRGHGRTRGSGCLRGEVRQWRGISDESGRPRSRARRQGGKGSGVKQHRAMR